MSLILRRAALWAGPLALTACPCAPPAGGDAGTDAGVLDVQVTGGTCSVTVDQCPSPTNCVLAAVVRVQGQATGPLVEERPSVQLRAWALEQSGRWFISDARACGGWRPTLESCVRDDPQMPETTFFAFEATEGGWPSFADRTAQIAVTLENPLIAGKDYGSGTLVEAKQTFACEGGADAGADGGPQADGGGDGGCAPTTCAAQGKDCGTVSDGCGGFLGCGVCVAPASCGGSGTPNVCGAWRVVTSPVSVDLNAVSGRAADDVWAVGKNDVVLRYTGASWSTVRAPTANATDVLYAAWAAAVNDAWTVGSAGRIFRWDGSTFSPVASGTTDDLFAVWGASANDVWAGGDNLILHWNGGAWSPAWTRTGAPYGPRSLWGASASEVWSAGNQTAMRWNGTNFIIPAALPGTFTGVLRAVFGSGSADVWAVGTAGASLHWNGSSWQEATSATGSELYGAWSAAPTATWAVGAGGACQYWNGGTWKLVATGSIERLNGVWGSAAADVWIVGNSGTILHHGP